MTMNESEKNQDNQKKNKSLKIAKINKMDFETALARLEEIVEILSSEKINLDSMIETYEEAIMLKDFCNKKISEAQLKIETIEKK
jgi:exodeoxyribonuclease VII small subunit